jgi:hypothetical protein
MAAPSVTATIRFTGGPSFGTTLVLGDVISPLGTGVLGTSANAPVEIQSKVTSAHIRRGRTRVLDKFEAGTAVITVVDTDGSLDPANGSYTIVPNRQLRLSATYAGVERYLFSGFIDSWSYRYEPGTTAAFLTITAVDAFRLLNLADFTTLSGASAGDSTGERVGQILDAVSWPSSQREVDTGDTTVQADAGTTRSALSVLQVLADTELGGFWITTQGDAKFLSRSSTVKALDTAATVFDDDGTDIAYQGVRFQVDDTLLANRVSVTAAGGSAQVVSDAASITEYFERDLTRTGLLMDSSADALSQARAILAARKDAGLRIESLTLDGTEDNAARVAAILDLDFFAPITVNRTTAAGRITKTLTVQGIQHTMSPHGGWQTTFSTAEPLVDSFLLNSTTRGVLGTSDLGY